MDQSDDSRERAVSSEPCSTRPNPFDDGDLPGPKRRRTSLSGSGSRSRSVETLVSQDDGGSPAVASASNMTIDTPDPGPPSTPPAQTIPPVPEPHSSRVTINLRHSERDSDGAAVKEMTPESPTPAPPAENGDVKVSIEESEVDMVSVPPAELSSATVSELDSTEAPAVDAEADGDLEDELEYLSSQPAAAMMTSDAIGLTNLMFEFPYHSVDETYYDTVTRLIQYFNSQPSQFDDVLAQLHAWMAKFLTWAGDVEVHPILFDSLVDNRNFWLSFPDLYWSFFVRKNALAKLPQTRELAGQIAIQLAKLSAYLVRLDCRTLANVADLNDLRDLDLFSPGFLQVLVALWRRDESQQQSVYGNYGSEPILEALELCNIFLAHSGWSIAMLCRFVELLANLHSKLPKMGIQPFVGACEMADSIVRDAAQKLSYLPETSPALARAKKNVMLGLRLFKTVSGAFAVAVEKSVNHISPEHSPRLIGSLTDLLKSSLAGDNEEAVQLVEEHSKRHPEIPDQFLTDAIAWEWRFDVLTKLIRSRQMHLRVMAVSNMCNDLVSQWRKYQDNGDEPLHFKYVVYLSQYLLRTGLVDYILSPTCHPEISQESHNIIGFLVVAKTYTPAHTDLLWQTVTTAQDPRVADALILMVSRISQVFEHEQLCYFCDKLMELPVDSFTSRSRQLAETVIAGLLQKLYNERIPLPITPYQLCIRLLQQSSVYGPQSTNTHTEIQQFAAQKLRDLLQGASPESRKELLSGCIKDVADKSATTSGSLLATWILIRPTLQRDLQILITEHSLTQLLVDELEATIARAKTVGITPVYASPISTARRELILNTVVHFGSSITSELGLRLWDLLVGPQAACQEDRKLGWQNLNMALKRNHFQNPFLSTCLQEYLPKLPPSCYTEGTLEFIREALTPLLNDPSGLILDDEESVRTSGVELLWQMILAAPPGTIEASAINMLVNDVYVDSKPIQSFPAQRARKVHFGLVNRCLDQLKSAAQKLKSFSDGTTSGDEEPMVIVATEEQQQEQELRFTRSLQVLRSFLRVLQSKSNFSAQAPDLRSLILQPPGEVEGDSAELKYQSFDGENHTEVKTLSIGRRNTAASLLASLREATGFDNYRIYYRGRPLTPSETEICKSLEDLNIHNGLILVRKETDTVSSPVRIKPGASPLEIEILSHFQDLWEYLSMDERLSKEIYAFLIKLPADDSVLSAFENPATSYRDVFPLNQPFKCLYALHAMREFLSTRRLKSNVMQFGSQDAESKEKTISESEEALLRAMSLTVAAICDRGIVERCSTAAMQALLTLNLVDNFEKLLKESSNLEPVTQFLTADLYKRLLEMMSAPSANETSQYKIEVITRAFEAMLESCARSREFWQIFQTEVGVQEILPRLLLNDSQPFVRQKVAKLISSKSFYNSGTSGVMALDFAEFFWPVVYQLLPVAVHEPQKCDEVLALCLQLLKKLSDSRSPVIDLPATIQECGNLLSEHKPTENITHPDRGDVVSLGLIHMLHYGLKQMIARGEPVEFPLNFAKKLFWQHLFPMEDIDGPLVPQVILSTSARTMLSEIIFILVRDDAAQFTGLLRDLDELTPYDHRDQDPYKYELPQLFDRSKAIRAPCGYAGLRNLSNTCYLNSLFTQLFMNPGFRRFILETPVPPTSNHSLLAETQILFANLQDSIRRFIDPQGCVSQIMTYEETAIDIHNQMDVDEFYNLLFDRWEAQMPSESAKKALRSIYGGQLVQQVKSNECEHVSERLEPFSAIQCDIKGKANLEESLQAYVDGEIMDGDNKYKCSFCDRHVDAVKRACLKDIPDNLLFHLKRFDFNLRTLTRSKINDYFPFPTRINMQPYTIEHLSNPENEAKEDWFELVGVLVHSGTAESGHYYSYIRERPSSGTAETWVEFNDDAVSSWDPTLMESSCFGGQDYRQPFDNQGMYEKVYSAYMLFYQRSSSLKRDQELLKQSGMRSPLRFDLPAQIDVQVKADNWGILQRHCLNDASHIPFVHQVLAKAFGPQCSVDHKVENLAMRVAIGHLDQVASRAKEIPDFDLLKNLVATACQRCPRCCYALFEYFKLQPEALRFLLQKNPEQYVRNETATLLLYSLAQIKIHFPEQYGIADPSLGHSEPPPLDTRRLPALYAAVGLFNELWDTFHTSLRAWPEYFGAMARFATAGEAEAAAFLDEDFLHKVLLVITADPSIDLPPQYARMLATVTRRMQTRPPSYEAVIALTETLICALEEEINETNIVEQAEGRLQLALRNEVVPWTVHEVNLVHRDWGRNQGNIFVDKLISLNQNQSSTDAILGHLMSISSMMDTKILVTIRLGVTGQLVTHNVAAYLRAATHYVQSSNNRDNVQRLITYTANQCKHIQNADGRAFLDFFRATFESPREDGESETEVLVQAYENLYRWVPGLLGYIDHTVSYDVDNFLQLKLFKYGVSPAFDEDEGGLQRSQAMTVAGRQLGIACLQYLQETYVSRGEQAARDTVYPLERVIQACKDYFTLGDNPVEDGLDAQFAELCQAVLEPMGRLTVDEIEDDGSEWEENSVASSAPMDSLADVNMHAAGDIQDI